MLVDDFKLPKTVDPRVRDMLRQIAQILNEDGYQRKVYTAAPSTTSPGFEGEKRLVISGASMTEYAYVDDSWWYASFAAVS